VKERGMTNFQNKIKEVIAQYKADFNQIDKDERYKWIAIKHFQDNWDIDSPDFADMLERSFSKHVNLLGPSGAYQPLKVIIDFTKREPETVRELFRTLYDEKLPLESRISKFTDGVKGFVEKMKQDAPNKWKSTFQDQRAICVYLTFKFPEEYYLYKYAVLKSAAILLDFELTANRMSDCRRMYDAIREVASQDDELIKMSRNRLDKNSYQDPNNRMLAQCIAYCAQRIQLKKEEAQRIAAQPSIVREFRKWLEEPMRKNGKPYDYKTIKVYIQFIEAHVKGRVPLYTGNANLFTYDSIEAFKPQHKILAELITNGKAQVNGAFPKVLRLYEQFLIERSSPTSEPPADTPAITKDDNRNIYNREMFLEEVYLAADDYDSLINQLIRKKNLILQGAPGVGKTFAAVRLAYSLLGEQSSERLQFVQFHQSYGYEDFVLGYRPNESGFSLEYGVFYLFCKEAAKDPDNEWYFLIDEINRGNISKIFGELLMLIEADKRSEKYAVRLHGIEEPFYIPENVNIIGMMNTADRSIALIDYALRRRFAFYSLEPAFEKESFRDYMESKNSEKFNALIELVSKLNDDIADDPLLGSGFKIGHSYFCIEESDVDELLSDIILYEIRPLLSEYWVDEPVKVQEWTSRLLELVL
jgi:5-methylcytosine-specific restriction protein B